MTLMKIIFSLLRQAIPSLSKSVGKDDKGYMIKEDDYLGCLMSDGVANGRPPQG